MGFQSTARGDRAPRFKAARNAASLWPLSLDVDRETGAAVTATGWRGVLAAESGSSKPAGARGNTGLCLGRGVMTGREAKNHATNARRKVSEAPEIHGCRLKMNPFQRLSRALFGIPQIN
jgi:hypothetical protein